MSLENKVAIVTSPTYYHADQLSVMLYDVSPMDIDLILQSCMDSGIQMSLHLAYSDKSEREWILNTARQVDIVVLNLKKHDLVKGYILNSSNVMYYNTSMDLKQLNTNEIKDPVDFILRLLNERRER